MISLKRLGSIGLIAAAIGYFSFGAAAQTAPPADLTGEALKTWLKQNYYDGKHTSLGYNTARMYMYNYIDNKNNLIDCVYSGYQVSWTYGGTGTNPAPINCEHTIPQSFFGEGEPMRGDLHHLFPTYGTWNSNRSNYPFREIADNSTTKWMIGSTVQSSIPASNINAYSEATANTFEPREEHKGNVARAVFYFFTMYPTQAGSITSVAEPDMLYQWHLQDPVDANELSRNTLIAQYQGDRNPYIDNPDAVGKAWGFTGGGTVTIPSVPSGLALTTGTSSFGLSWGDVSTETGYSVYRSTDNLNFSLLATLGANVVSYTDAAIIADTPYYYNVQASNTAGASASSNTVNGTIVSGPVVVVPSVPSGLALTVNTSSLSLSWADVSTETGYSVFRSTDNVTFTSLATLAANAVSYTDATVTAGTTYYYNVKASNTAGASASSNTVSGTIVPVVVIPSVPSGLALTTGASSFGLSWGDVSTETGYSVFRSTDNVTFTSLATLAANTVSYTDAAVTAGTAYYYNVKASNTAGFSAASTTVTGTIAVTGGGTATSLFISEYVEGSSNDKAIEIANFTGASVNLSAYALQKQSNGAGAWGAALPLSGTLAHGQVYVVANSSATAALLAKAQQTSSADAILFNGNDAVALTKSGVIVDVVGTYNGGTANFALDVTLARKSTVANGSTTYSAAEWTVLALNTITGLGSHTYSSSAPATCNAPTGLAASAIGSTTATLSWAAVTGAATYAVQYRAVGTTTWTSASSSTASLALTGLSASKAYEAQVKTNCASNASAFTASANFSTTAASVAYCAAGGTSSASVADEWINRVVFGTINNTSGKNNGYGNFTAQSTSLGLGKIGSITIYPSWTSTVYAEGYVVWIDYNQDGDFVDAGEKVLTSAAVKTTSVTGSFTVPTTAKLGATRVRVMMQYNATPTTSCQTFSYGEAEDYTLNVIPAAMAYSTTENEGGAQYATQELRGEGGISGPQAVFAVYPNPTIDMANISFDVKNAEEKVKVSVYSAIGKEMQVLANGSFSKGQNELKADLAALPKGAYFVKIISDSVNETVSIIKQ